MKNQWPTITDLEGRSLLGRAGDLRARLLLNELGLIVLKEQAAGFRAGICVLDHAERYLADRLAYELCPHPSGMFLVERL